MNKKSSFVRSLVMSTALVTVLPVAAMAQEAGDEVGNESVENSDIVVTGTLNSRNCSRWIQCHRCLGTGCEGNRRCDNQSAVVKFAAVRFLQCSSRWRLADRRLKRQQPYFPTKPPQFAGFKHQR